MVTRRQGGRTTPRGIKGSFDWECALLGTASIPSGASQFTWVVLPSTVRTLYTDPTLFATRLWFSARSDVVAASSISAIAVGIIAWDAVDDSLVTGLASQSPSPITECDRDWITRAVALFPAGTPAGSVQSLTLDFTHLSSARRRLGNTKGILACIEANGISGSANADVRCLLRET